MCDKNGHKQLGKAGWQNYAINSMLAK